MLKKLLTIVAYIDSEETYERFEQSVLNQEIEKEQLELVFVDSICSEKTIDFVKNFSNNGIVSSCICKKGCSEVEAYNTSINSINSKFVNFTRTSAYFSENSIKSGLFNKEKLVSLKPVFVNTNGKKTTYKAVPLKKAKGKINLINNPTGFQLFVSAYFIPVTLLKEVSFNLNLNQEALYKFVIDLLVKSPEYTYLTNCYYYTHALEDTVGVAEIQYNKYWYITSLKDFIIPTLTEYSNYEFVKKICVYLVLAKYNCNLFNRNKNVLNSEEISQFEEYVGEFFSLVKDNTIFFEDKNMHLNLARSFMVHLLKLKYKNCELSVKADDNNFVFCALEKDNSLTEIPISLKTNEKVVINVLNYANGNLVIDGTFSPAVFLNDTQFVAYAELNGKKYYLNRNNIYSDNFSFGVSFYKKYRFNVEIPCETVGDLKFYFEFNNEKIPLKISGTGPFCRLNGWKNSYWHFSDKTVYYKKAKNGDILKIRKNNVLLNFFKEIYYIFKNLVNKKFSKKSIVASGFRVMYWLTRPYFCKKRIWLYFDKLYKAGDNAEYLFRYSYKQNDGIENYYLINKDSADYKRLKSKYGKNIIIFNSVKAKLYALNAECALATHCNVMGFLGYPKRVHPFFTNLYKLKVVCVQHGLTIQQIAVHQNRLVDNTGLYCCASKFEIDNLNQEIYGYYGNELKLVGLARYDGLKSNDKKQILITPTWRKECARGDSQMGSARKYNELFKTTEYFRLYNELINDKNLIETAKKCNYKIIYLLHPVVSSQIGDFTKNEFVKILAASGDMSYEKILTESSLMVTDYSGVQFDFAYQRKPIVYYHPSTLPPHYEEGCGFVYDKMGFGPIITEHNSLVKELCEYMENGCKIKEEYIKRADNFFAFDDFNNCNRIYNEVIEYVNK